MKELIEIQAELKAPKGQRNNFGKYNYRSCEDILEAVKPLATEKGCYILISDEVVMFDSRFYIKATAKIVNKDGLVVEAIGYAREPENKKGADESQITGAASSYARKYALNGLFCIDDTKDADTEKPHKQPPKPNKKKFNGDDAECQKAIEWIKKEEDKEKAIETIEKKYILTETDKTKLRNQK